MMQTKTAEEGSISESANGCLTSGSFRIKMIARIVFWAFLVVGAGLGIVAGIYTGYLKMSGEHPSKSPDSPFPTNSGKTKTAPVKDQLALMEKLDQVEQRLEDLGKEFQNFKQMNSYRNDTDLPVSTRCDNPPPGGVGLGASWDPHTDEQGTQMIDIKVCSQGKKTRARQATAGQEHDICDVCQYHPDQSAHQSGYCGFAVSTESCMICLIRMLVFPGVYIWP